MTRTLDEMRRTADLRSEHGCECAADVEALAAVALKLARTIALLSPDMVPMPEVIVDRALAEVQALDAGAKGGGE